MHHLLSVNDLKKEDIDAIMKLVPIMMGNWSYDPPNCNKILATLFFEPSTRTKLSFQSAMYRLGGKIIDLPSSSSQKKGETDLDTIRTISEYADILAIRHPQSGIMPELAAMSTKPVINAGDGSNEHPTQALLDLYTIRQYVNNKSEITIMFTGDLFYSRTVSSLVKLLEKEDYFVRFIFTNKCSDPSYICGNEQIIPESLKVADILYMTRPQRERWDASHICSDFTLTKKLAETMKEDAIIMHPLPRNDEIHPDVDKDHRVKYWEQVKNGLYTRMAILNYMLWK